MKFSFRLFTSCLFLFVVTAIFAQEIPPVVNFSPQDYGAENQNWSISQSNEKYIYVANTSGLLAYNGANWKQYASPNNTIIRSVAVIADKIYTGAYMEFGYWEKNEFGSLRYTSLSKRIKSVLIEEDFWNIVNYDSYIIFQSLHRLYIYNTSDQSFKIFNSENVLPKVFKVGQNVYFQIMGKGLFEIDKGVPKLISDNLLFKNTILVNMFNVQNKTLIATQDKGFYMLSGDGLVTWNSTFNNQNKLNDVYSCIQLKKGGFIIGTISKGIYYLDEIGNLVYAINQDKGLFNNTILSIFEDVSGNLWLGLDNGISLLNINSPIYVYNEFTGNLGSVYTSTIFKNNLYLGTNHGLFYKPLNEKADFNFIEGTNGQVWCLKVIDDSLLCGHNSGTFEVVDNKAKLIANKMGTWNISPIPQHENLLIQGNYDGLYILEKVNNQWKYRNKLQNFDISSRFFEFSAENQLLMSNLYKGVFDIKINDAYTKVEHFSVEETAPVSLINFNNQLFYTSKKGIFLYDKNFKKFNKDSLMSTSFLKNEKYISGNLVNEKKSNTLWAFTKSNIMYFTQGKLDKIPKVNKISLAASYRNTINGYESVTLINENNYLIGTTRGYIVLDISKLQNNNFNIRINSIEKSVLDEQKKPVSFNDNAFKFIENNLYFEFSTPDFDKFTETVYQYQLIGMYDNWSAWSTDSEISFKNLPFGDYTFNVRAKIGNNTSVNVATYSFTINRPWYLSNWMLLFYTVSILGLLYLIHFVNKRYYNKQKQSLIKRNRRKFEINKLESEKVIMKLKNEKLQHDIDSKTKELSSSTLNIIKKNELLNTIKKELENVNDTKNVKPVIRIINNNLTNNDDWVLFEEAFNNADTDFLKKVKKAHPVLTPNDLRLCAYLRLNLSSKEIAPLLNISSRSVEIKRYRLRKKMELEHEKSLVEYILQM